ncbi:MAG: NAD-dependent epimerase/dehydratase family protein [Candidatus Dormibacteria bacterium]
MITIFGHTGFIGSHLVQHSDRKDLYLPPRYSRRPHSESTDIINFISTIHNYNIFDNVTLDVETNLLVLCESLESWRNHCPTAVYTLISSWFVYGGERIRHNVKETDYCDPHGFYSITKRAAEQLLISYCGTFGLNYRILRLGNVIGPGDNKVSKQKNAIQYMVNEMAAGKDVYVYGADNGLMGHFFRDYIHVDDVADAIEFVLQEGELNTIYNIGNGDVAWPFIYILTYCQEVLAKRGYKPGNIFNMASPDFHKLVQTESFTMNVDKLNSLGFKTKYIHHQLYDALLDGHDPNLQTVPG